GPGGGRSAAGGGSGYPMPVPDGAAPRLGDHCVPLCGRPGAGHPGGESRGRAARQKNNACLTRYAVRQAVLCCGAGTPARYVSPRKEHSAAPMEVAKAACSGMTKRMPWSRVKMAKQSAAWGRFDMKPVRTTVSQPQARQAMTAVVPMDWRTILTTPAAKSPAVALSDTLPKLAAVISRGREG